MYSLINTSQQLLIAVKQQKEVKTLSLELQNIPLARLDEELNSDSAKKVFWINLYNAWFQILVAQSEKPKNLFTSFPFQFANFEITLDEIEHGILRKLKPHPSTGIPKKYNDVVKQLALQVEDNRIHFALNCGLKSCPPISFYNIERVDEQLDLATLAYLEQETTYHIAQNHVETNELLHWYMDDFDGESGLLKLLEGYNLIPEGSHPKLTFKTFDKADSVLNFRL